MDRRKDCLLPMRLRTRRDGNEREIIQALEAAACDVVQIDYPCDLLVGRAGVNHLIEVKLPDGKLREGQERFAETWRGSRVHVVRTVEEAFRAVGLHR
jgi:hypothetical protein